MVQEAVALQGLEKTKTKLKRDCVFMCICSIKKTVQNDAAYRYYGNFHHHIHLRKRKEITTNKETSRNINFLYEIT